MEAANRFTHSVRFEEAVSAHVHGHSELAESLYRTTLEIDPQHPQASQFLGVLLFQLGRRQEGLEWMQRALCINPFDPEAWSNCGNAYRVLDRGEEAIESLLRAISLNPNFAPAYCTLSACYRKPGHLRDAIQVARQAVRLQPETPQSHCNLGLALLDAGEVESAIAAFQQAIYLAPNLLEAHQGLLFAMLYSDIVKSSDFLKQAQKFGKLYKRTEWPIPDQLKTIAFISGDFCHHPVGHFMRPHIESLAKDFNLILLSTSLYEDDLTDWFRSQASEFRNVRDLSVKELTKLCRDFEVDCCVDLAGHTAANRMEALAQRLAPIQVSYLGYSGTTGLPNMDWIIADQHLIPDSHKDFYSEQVAHLSHSVFCPSYWKRRPKINRDSSQPLTFGSFNNLSKMSPSCLKAWNEILLRTPGSRLKVKSKNFTEPFIRNRFLSAFDEDIVLQGRVEILEWVMGSDPLADYESIDIALDTFPYSGATTTCDALSCGVPIVSLAGDRYCGRMSASILHNCSLNELVVESVKDYVELASNLAIHADSPHRDREFVAHSFFSSSFNEPDTTGKDFKSCLLDLWTQSKNTDKNTRIALHG